MISLAKGVGYVHEPFNRAHGRCVCGYDIPLWYKAVTPENEASVRRHFEHLLRFGPQTVISDLKNGKLKKLGVQLRRGQVDILSAIRNDRPLIKDPLALLAADWLADNLNAQVIITVRHPAAFVDSLIRKNWMFDFNNLTQQAGLMAGKLHPFAEELKRMASLQGDGAQDAKVRIEEQAILLWKVLHHVIANYQTNCPDWMILRHEDVSTTPFAHFEKIYDWLGLEFSPETRDQIDGFVNPITESAGKRNSKDNVKRWKTKLTPELIAEIRSGTEEVAAHFYTDKDW